MMTSAWLVKCIITSSSSYIQCIIHASSLSAKLNSNNASLVQTIGPNFALKSFHAIVNFVSEL